MKIWSFTKWKSASTIPFSSRLSRRRRKLSAMLGTTGEAMVDPLSTAIRHDKPFGGGPPGSIDEKAGRLILLPHAAFFQGIEKLVAQRIDEQTGVADELLQHGLVIFRDRGASGDRAVDDDGPSRILCQAIEPVLKIFHVRLVEQIILADDDDGIAPVIRIMQMLLQTCADLFRLTDVDGIRIVSSFPSRK